MKDLKGCLKGLWRMLSLVRGRVLLCSAIYLVEAVCALAFVWYSKKVIDIVTGGSSEPLMASVWLLVGIMVLQVAARIASRFVEGKLTVDAKIRMRSIVFDKAMRSTWQGRERFHSADVVNRLEEDIRVVSDFICSSLPSCVVTLFQLVAATVMLFVLSPSLAWILIWIMPVAVVGARLFFRRQRRLTNEIRSLDGQIQGHMQEHLQHRVLVKTLGSVEDVENDLDGYQSQERSKTVTRLSYSALSRTFMQVGFSAGYLLAFLWGCFGIKDGTVSYGLMVAFLQLVGQVQRPVAGLASYIPAFIRAISSVERLLDIEALPQEEDVKENMLEGCAGLRASGLSFAYPDSGPEDGLVLSELAFDFKPGTMTAICGPTGKGKSTLVQLMLGLLEPTAGKVVLYDAEGEELEAGPAARCNFMYVPQGNSLLSGTVRDNLLMACPQASEQDMKEALHTADADFILEMPKGLDTVCSEKGRGLSEGQAQRVAIARALLHRGSVLILDEATSALDSASENKVLGRIHDKYHSVKTIICITHRPAAASIADFTFNL